MHIFYPLVFVLVFTCNIHQSPKHFSEIRAEYVNGIKKLQIPPLQLNFKNNIPADKSTRSINDQMIFFQKKNDDLKNMQVENLNVGEAQDYDLMRYQIEFNIDRLDLEFSSIKDHSAIVAATSIYQIPNGKKWYEYFLKRWLGDNVSPDEIYQFGLEQIKRSRGNIESIRKKAGLSENDFYKRLNDSSFFLNNQDAINKRFLGIKATLLSNLKNIFFNYHIPDVKIARGTNAELAQTPGYYSDNVFYFNLFDKPYNMRQMDWLFIHEAIPGHHFQASITDSAEDSNVAQLFWYPGFGEGWAAYAEEYGKELGLYKTVYDELGRWEWDVVRSVRVALDVGINYYGWSDEKAMSFWKDNIKNQDDIAMREINRMKRWPVQVITYKYGASKFLMWKEKIAKKEGASFDIRRFHDQLLRRGSLPFSVLKKYIDFT